jgi:tetratricopeptide (TPR) repeat protein
MKFPTACWLAAAVLLVAPAPAQESAADLLQRGSAKHRSKDYPGAIADYTQAIALEPNNALAYQGRGTTYTATKNLPRAIADFTQAIELNPNLAQAYRSRATARMMSNDLAGWTADTNRAKDLEIAARSQANGSAESGRPASPLPSTKPPPSSPMPADPETTKLLTRSAARKAAGDLKGARADLEAAIERSPTEARVHLARGRLRLNTGEDSQALRDFERALELDPQLTEARVSRAVMLAQLGDTQGAFAEYDLLIAHQPQSPPGYWGRGQLRHEIGDYGGAISDFTAMLGAQPTLVKFYVPRGNARWHLGDTAGAIADYGHALRMDPTDEFAWWNRGLVRAKSGDKVGAIADFEELSKLKPAHFGAHAERARAKIDLARADEALADLNQALAAAPNQPLLLYARGLVQAAKRQHAAAIADFTAAIAQQKKLVGHFHLARAAARTAVGDTTGAEEDRQSVRKAVAALTLMAIGALGSEGGRGAPRLLDDAIELDPTTANHYVLRGKIHQRFDRHAQAVADFSRALELQPGLKEAETARAESLRYTAPPAVKRTATAKGPTARTQTTKSPTELTPLQRAFLQKQMKGDFAGAQADYTEVIAQQPKEPSAYLRRATMNLILDRTGEAIADLDQVLELTPLARMRSFAFLLRGAARQVQGDWAAAVADFDSSLAASPNLPAKTRFFRWHLLHRLGRPDTVSNLTAVTAQVDQEWVRLLGGYLEGKVSEADLLARTDEGDPTAVVRRRSAAYYHVAMTQLRQGERERAREFFQRAIAVDMKLGLASEERIAEHVLARAELARLTPPR